MAAVAVRASIRGTRGSSPDQRGPPTPNRLFVFLGIAATPIAYGLVLWTLELRLSAGVDTRLAPDVELFRRLLLWSSLTFAWAAAVTIGTQAWVVSRRWRQYSGLDF
ncbi:MAG TPA: hypothetical protein VJP06_04580, partial [Thermoplasmata archaeon]|nr:hypothetical protein [Thermoplasmata archaeon]